MGETMTLGIDMARACLFDPTTATPDLTDLREFRIVLRHLSQPGRPGRARHRRRVGHRRRHRPRLCRQRRARRLLDLQQEAGEALASELADAAPHAPLFMRCDVTDIAALQAAIGRSRERLGPIAVLVNNAANDDRHRVADVTPDYWDHAQDVNLRHQFFAAQAVHPHMKELGFGSIVNFSSIAWRFGAAEMARLCDGQGRGRRPDLRAGAGVRPRQHPRQRHRAGRGDHRAAAAALVSRRRRRSTRSCSAS